MRIVYIDSEFKCHASNDGTMTAVETDFFDGMCDAFVEGYCYSNVRGYVQIYPWKPYSELDAVQRAYERQEMADMQEALALLGVNVDE